ncbi:transposase family protein [Escherichia coli 2-156-04_S3_C1]|nr:transposase family protein [Escherichia coli 2-156-04_S3_C1]
MPARQVCQDFFHNALAPFHKYRQNALLDATIALINGASLTLTSIGRYLPGPAQVKNKIKRVDRLLGNESLHRDIPLIFSNIIAMLTSQLSLCVIAVDWSGYPSQEHHVLRASLLCDRRSLPLLSWIVPSEKRKRKANVAQLAREHGVDNNLIFKWLRLWQREGRISRRMPPTIVGPTVSQSFPASPTLVPVELIDTPRCATDAPAPEALSVACAASCHVEFHYGKMMLENPSPELLTVLIRELTGRGR